MEEAIVLELLKQYQKQYRTALELERITREMEQAVRSNDRISLRLTLDMRQQSITEMQNLKCGVAAFLEGVSMSERILAERLLKWPPEDQAEGELEQKLQDTSRSVKAALTKAIEIDRRINLKMGDKKSFYYGKEP